MSHKKRSHYKKKGHERASSLGSIDDDISGIDPTDWNYNTAHSKQSNSECKSSSSSSECPPDCRVIIGPTGPQGPPGCQGPPGHQGIPGPQGMQGPRGCKGEMGCMGPPGSQGCRGERGPVGPMGLTGERGYQGHQGAQGPVGPQGMAGKQGPTGPKGDQGAPGLAGPQGSQGIQGIQGATGHKGDQGAKGEQGPEGPRGPPGVCPCYKGCDGSNPMPPKPSPHNSSSNNGSNDGGYHPYPICLDKIKSVNMSTTLTMEDDTIVVTSNTAITLTLPYLENITVENGVNYTTKKLSIKFLTGSGHLVKSQSGNTINRLVTQYTPAQFSSVTFYALGNSWISF